MMPDDADANFAVILAAAGRSTRFSGDSPSGQNVKKVFAHLNGKPLWLHSAERFYAREDVVQIIVAVSPEDIVWFRQYYLNEINNMLLITVTGGYERMDTVQAALRVVSASAGYVAVHDAARPCVSEQDIDAVFKTAIKTGAALLASPVNGTLKRVNGVLVEETVDRRNIWEAQTPQVFRRGILERAYQQETRQFEHPATDDAQLVEMLGEPVSIVPGNRLNVKITDQHDFALAQWIMRQKISP